MRQALLISSAILVFVFASGCASTDWEAKYLEEQEQSRALLEENDSLTQKIAEQEAYKDEARRELGKTRQSVDLLAQKLRNMPPPTPQVVQAPPKDELAEVRAEYERLKREYGEMVKMTPEGNIEITLNSDVTFGAGKKSLTAKGKQILDSVALQLESEFAGHLVRVVGHTDSDPIKKSPFDDNWELGAQRALSVTRYLEANHGLEPSRLVAASRGQTAPVAENSSKQGKSRNRRVEIVVVIPKKQIVGDLSAQK